jgi:hypothetical protein
MRGLDCMCSSRVRVLAHHVPGPQFKAQYHKKKSIIQKMKLRVKSMCNAYILDAEY